MFIYYLKGFTNTSVYLPKGVFINTTEYVPNVIALPYDRNWLSVTTGFEYTNSKMKINITKGL